MFPIHAIKKSVFCILFFVLFITATRSYGQSYPNFCSGSTLDISPALPVTGKTYTCIPRASTTVSGAVSQTTLTPTIIQTLNIINANSASASIIFDVKDDAAKSYVLTVTVLQTPKINTASPAWTSFGCGTLNYTMSATAVVTVLTDGWSWTRPDTLGAKMITSTSNVINDNLVNSSAADMTIPYTVSMTGSNGCKSVQVLNYKISPTPIISDPSRYDTICSGTGIAFTPKTQLTGTYITWNNPGTGGITGGTTVTLATKLTSFNQTLTNTTASSINSVYNIYPVYQYTGFTCTGPAFQELVTVNPRPKIASTTATVCSGTSLKFTPTTSGNIIPTSTQYTWAKPQYSDSTQISGGTGLNQSPVEYADPPIFQTLINKSVLPQTATYNIYAKAGSCIATDPFDLIVTVNPLPNVTIPADTLTNCSGSSLVFSSKTPLPIPTTYSWAAPQMIPASSFSGTGSTAQTNQATFSPILNNLRTISSYATYVVLPSSSGCVGNPFNITLKIDPVASLGTQTISVCSDVNFISTPNPVPIGTRFTWSPPTLATNLVLNAGDKNTNILGDTAIIGNLTYTGTNSGGNATYTVIPKSGNCVGNSFSLVVTVKPIPVVTTASQTACSGVSFSSVPSNNLTGVSTSYTWDTPVVSPAGSLAGGSGNTSPLQSINQTLINTSNDFAAALYTVIPIAQGCSGKPFKFTATVNPSPNILNKDTTVCPGLPFSMNPSPLPFITNYTWEQPVFNIPNTILGGTSQQNSVPNFSQVLTNTTNSIDVMATYNVTPKFGECVGKPFSIVVTVKASPYITDTLVSTVCSGSPFNVTLPSNLPNGSMFKWEEPTYTNGITGGSLQAILQNSISQILKNTNSDTTTGIAYYNVTPVANGCQGKSFPVKIFVKTSSATLVSPLILPPICSGTNLTYVPLSNFTNTAFSWIRDSISGISNPSTSGYADINEKIINTTGDPITVNYRFSLFFNGCKNGKEQVVSTVINPKPILTSGLSPLPICSEGTFNYTPVSNTRDVSFTWARSYVVGISQGLTNGTNSISEKLTNTTYNIVQVPYVYTLTANGCTNKQTVYEVVNPVLTLNDQIYPVCSGVNFKITPPNDVNAVFIWNRPYLSNGLIGGNENNILPSNSLNDIITNSTDTSSFALYDLTPIIPGAASGGCLGNPFKVKILVNPVPVLSSAKNLPSICSGTQFKYTPTSNTPGTIFTWFRDAIDGISNGSNKGNGIISETLMDTTIRPLNISYRIFTTYNGCTDSLQFIKFTINPSPIIKDQHLTICSGKAFSLPIDLEPTGTQYTWSSTSVMPANTLTNSNGKSTPQVQVYDTLTNKTNDVSSIFYTINPVNPICTLQPFNLVVTVNPISVIGDQNTFICSNKIMAFEPANVPLETTYKWLFNEVNPSYYLSGYLSNDSAYQNSIKQNLINSGDSSVTASYQIQTNTKGCIGKPFNLKVTVNPIPKIRISGSANICINAADTINLNFTGYGPWTLNYIDNKDNILTQKSGFLTNSSTFIQPKLPNDTVYRINVMNISDKNCSSESNNNKSILTFTQKLNPLPADSVIAPNGNLICLGQFQAMYIKPMAKTYKWYRNDSLIQNANSINYNAFTEGKYNAYVTDSLGCSAMTVNDIKMADMKNFKISFTNDSVNCINNLKQFLNLSDTSLVRNISWKWDFNGEGTKSGYNTTFNFAKSGMKRISLFASIPSCTYSISKDSLISILAPKPGLLLDQQSTNAFRQIQLKARSFEGVNVSYDWEPAWGLNFFNIYNPVFSYYQSQTFFIKMRFPEGCITTDTLKVSVFDSNITDILIPKSFTPNGDGTNDKLLPYVAGIKIFGFFRIYNKYGRVVFESKNQTNGWDGRFNGIDQPMDTYLWEAAGIDFNGKLIQRNGNVILIR